MAHVASNNNGNTNLPTTTPFMDRLTHEVIKETSKSLRYYLDVKRREDAFVLNPNSTSVDSIPLKARFIYGTTKEYPPLYGSYHSDNDVKVHFRSFQQQPKQPHSTSNSPEKQMCREELNYHMRTPKYLPRENQKFGELRLGPMSRSISSCSRHTGRDTRRRTSKSAFRSPGNEKDHLINDTADILANMVQTRRSIYQTNILSQQIPSFYDSRNANPSPRQTDDQSHIQGHPPSPTYPKTTEQPRKQKRRTENALEKATSIMYNAKPITGGLLCEYKISVTTGNCNGASTNAPIRIKLYGTKGYTKFLDLVNSETHRVPFLKDQTDLFVIQTDHVGQLAGITIGHDQTDTRSGWFLDRVSIEDSIREMTFEIPCNAWLSSTSNDQKTMRDLQVISMKSQKQRRGSNERREEIDSQSSSSTTSTRRTSNTYSVNNGSQNDQSTDRRQMNKHPKQQQQQQQRLSIGSTRTAKKPTSFSEISDHLFQPTPPTTVESHFNRKQFATPSVPIRRFHSPIINSSSSETEIENHLPDRTRSTIPTSPRTRSNFNHTVSHTTDSTTNDRPPARLEKHDSPVSLSPERPIRNKDETSETEAHSFFD